MGYKLTHDTDELKKLISEHPDWPICILAGEDANCGDYGWMYCTDVRFGEGEILDACPPCSDEKTYTDRSEFHEDMTDWIMGERCGRYGPLDALEDDAFDRIVEAEVKKYDGDWKKCIMIWATN